MTVNDLTIREITARAVVAPLKRPVRTAVGTIPSAPLVLIDVLTDQGSAGRSYIFAYTPAVLVPLVRLIDEIAQELKGKPVAPVLRMREAIETSPANARSPRQKYDSRSEATPPPPDPWRSTSRLLRRSS